MSLTYHIYRNNMAGGPVDLTTIVATTASLTWSDAALTPPADVTYLVRAYDTVTSLEDDNGDARVRIVVDSTGADVTARPAAPAGVSATPLAGGSVRVAWMHVLAGQPAPTGFHVYIGSPTVSYATPAATVAYSMSNPAGTYTATLTGLTDGTTYAVGVRAYNGTAEEPNTASAIFTALATGPTAVVSLTVTAVP